MDTLDDTNLDTEIEFVSDRVTRKRIAAINALLGYHEALDSLHDEIKRDPKYTIFRHYKVRSSDTVGSKGLAMNYFISKFLGDIENPAASENRPPSETSEDWRSKLIVAYKDANEGNFKELMDIILEEWIRKGQSETASVLNLALSIDPDFDLIPYDEIVWDYDAEGNIVNVQFVDEL